MSQTLFKASSLTCALWLAACGGGSSNSTVNSNGPTVDISSSNQQAVATEVNSNALQFTGSVLDDTLQSISIDSTAVDHVNLRKLITTLRQQLHLQAHPVQAQAVASSITVTDNCDFGGTVTQVYNDNNNNNEWDASESGSVTFTNCTISADGVKISGSMQDDYVSQNLATAVDQLTFNNLTVSKGVISTNIASGSVTSTNTLTGSVMSNSLQSSDNYLTKNLSVTVSQGAKSESFTLNEDLTLTQSSPDISKQTISGHGSIKSNNANINGQVTFDITTPIIVSVAQPMTVTAGQMTISGSGGTALYISFATPTTGTATLQVKKDGQNVGNPKEVPVATLLAGLTAAN